MIFIIHIAFGCNTENMDKSNEVLHVEREKFEIWYWRPLNSFPSQFSKLPITPSTSISPWMTLHKRRLALCRKATTDRGFSPQYTSTHNGDFHWWRLVAICVGGTRAPRQWRVIHARTPRFCVYRFHWSFTIVLVYFHTVTHTHTTFLTPLYVAGEFYLWMLTYHILERLHGCTRKGYSSLVVVGRHDSSLVCVPLRSGVGKFAWPRGYVFVSNDLCHSESETWHAQRY